MIDPIYSPLSNKLPVPIDQDLLEQEVSKVKKVASKHLGAKDLYQIGQQTAEQLHAHNGLVTPPSLLNRVKIYFTGLKISLRILFSSYNARLQKCVSQLTESSSKQDNYLSFAIACDSFAKTLKEISIVISCLEKNEKFRKGLKEEGSEHTLTYLQALSCMQPEEFDELKFQLVGYYAMSTEAISLSSLLNNIVNAPPEPVEQTNPEFNNSPFFWVLHKTISCADNEKSLRRSFTKLEQGIKKTYGEHPLTRADAGVMISVLHACSRDLHSFIRSKSNTTSALTQVITAQYAKLVKERQEQTIAFLKSKLQSLQSPLDLNRNEVRETLRKLKSEHALDEFLDQLKKDIQIHQNVLISKQLHFLNQYPDIPDPLEVLDLLHSAIQEMEMTALMQDNQLYTELHAIRQLCQKPNGSLDSRLYALHLMALITESEQGKGELQGLMSTRTLELKTMIHECILQSQDLTHYLSLNAFKELVELKSNAQLYQNNALYLMELAKQLD